MWHAKTCFFVILTASVLADTSPVTLTITMPKEESYFCEPIPTTYTYTNVSATTVLLPRELVQYPKGNPDFHIIQKSTGLRAPTLERFFPSLSWLRMTPFQRCVVLHPGESVCHNLDLVRRYYPDNFQYGGALLDEPGVYEVTLIYENTFYNVEASTFTVLGGILRSNTLTLRLRPPNEIERRELFLQLESNDKNVWRRALDSLSSARDDRILPRVYEMLASENGLLQGRACAAMARFRGNQEVLSRLHDVALNADTDWKRECAVLALGQIRNPASVPVLASLCLQSSFQKTRVSAARILLMDYESAEHLEKIEAVMERAFAPEGSVTWKAKIRELRKTVPK